MVIVTAPAPVVIFTSPLASMAGLSFAGARAGPAELDRVLAHATIIHRRGFLYALMPYHGEIARVRTWTTTEMAPADVRAEPIADNHRIRRRHMRTAFSHTFSG